MENVRKPDEKRLVRIIPDYTEMAAGSVLIECGRTRVICTASVQEGVPPFLKGKGQRLADRGIRDAARRDAGEKGARRHQKGRQKR